MIVGYSVLNKFFIDRNSGQFKAPINTLSSEARVFTPKDTAISTPNSDTPYSMAMLDLRAEPMVISVPAVDKKRYYSVQLIDGNAYNYGYIGSRATGSDGENRTRGLPRSSSAGNRAPRLPAGRRDRTAANRTAPSMSLHLAAGSAAASAGSRVDCWSDKDRRSRRAR